MSCISLYTYRQLWLINSKMRVKSEVKGQASVMFSMLLRLNVALLNGNHHKHLQEVVILSALIPGLNRTLKSVARAQSVTVIFTRRVAEIEDNTFSSHK